VKVGESFMLRRIEGERVPTVNAQPVAASGAQLSHGDVIDLAGIRIEFLAPGSAGASSQTTPIDAATEP
jgi:hypothetical protein